MLEGLVYVCVCVCVCACVCVSITSLYQQQQQLGQHNSSRSEKNIAGNAKLLPVQRGQTELSVYPLLISFFRICFISYSMNLTQVKLG